MDKKELKGVKVEVGTKAQEIITSLESSNLSFGQGLDALALALVVSALNAEIDRENFIKTVSARYDYLSSMVEKANNIH